MNRIAAWVERHWHGPHTRRSNAKHRRTEYRQCMTTNRKQEKP